MDFQTLWEGQSCTYLPWRVKFVCCFFKYIRAATQYSHNLLQHQTSHIGFSLKIHYFCRSDLGGHTSQKNCEIKEWCHISVLNVAFVHKSHCIFNFSKYFISVSILKTCIVMGSFRKLQFLLLGHSYYRNWGSPSPLYHFWMPEFFVFRSAKVLFTRHATAKHVAGASVIVQASKGSFQSSWGLKKGVTTPTIRISLFRCNRKLGLLGY